MEAGIEGGSAWMMISKDRGLHGFPERLPLLNHVRAHGPEMNWCLIGNWPLNSSRALDQDAP